MNGSTQEPGQNPTTYTAGSPARFRTRAEKRIAFLVALDNGSTAAEASRLVGISLTTAYQWSKHHKSDKFSKVAQGAIVTKTQVAEALSELVTSKDIDPRDKVAAAKAVSDVMGYNAPVKSEVTTRVIPESVMFWLVESSNVIDVSAEPATLAEPIAPKALSPKPSSE